MDNNLESYEGIERQPLLSFAEKAYLDYSMYVVLDRALPNIADGLKPVQRRIVYAMSELGLAATSKPKKAARTVGDVLGKFHPHGDSACYEAMVLMAQPFSYRYPLVDGQGNWGAPDDPKSFAAMRYTEARLSRYAEVLLAELGQGTVDMQPNFDGTLEEPTLLPARLPNVLLNGATGIAVGMATDVPPHNAREVAAAAIHLLHEPGADLRALCEHVPAPDFPTAAEIITPRDDLREIYATGNGLLRARAAWRREKGGDIVIDALPYQVSGARVLEQIAAQMRDKKLPMVEDLRDESDHENPTRLVIVPRSNRVDIDALMAHLFATTDLEKGYRVNLNLIGLDGRPRVKNLKTILTEWLDFRIGTVRRRLNHRLARVKARLHVLEGLLQAYLNIDEVIAIIRREERPRPALMARFNLSEVQADAILDLRLRHLMRLEEMKIRTEQDELDAERERLEALLGSEKRLNNLVAKELHQDAERYGDDRRSPLVDREPARALDKTELMPTEAITVVLSRRGWVRAAKGNDVEGDKLSYRAGDEFLAAATGRSNQLLVFLDSSGRAYAVSAHDLPSARSQGEPLTGRVNPPDGVHFIAPMLGNADSRYVLSTDRGYGFIVSLGDLHTRQRGGKSAVSVSKGAQMLPPQSLPETDNHQLAVATAQGRLLLFPVDDLPALARGKGNKLIQIGADDTVVATVVIGPTDALCVYSGKRTVTLKRNDIAAYSGNRASRGRKLPRGFQRINGLLRVEG